MSGLGVSILMRGRNEGMASGIAKGKAEGKAEGMLTTLCKLVRNGLISVSDAAKNASMSEVEFLRVMEAYPA